MAVKLIAKQGFSSFGTEYAAGEAVDPVVAAKWPDGAMARRLSGGFLAYEDVPEDNPVAGETRFDPIQRASNLGQLPEDSTSEDQDGPTPEFGKMSTEELAEFAKTNELVVDLDAAGGIRAQRNAVREAYAAKLESAPLGGTAGGQGPAA